MNKKVIYSILLALLLGSLFFYQYQNSTRRNGRVYINQPVMQDGNYLDGLFFEKYYNEKQPLNPFVALKAGSEFLFHFSANDSTLLYHILEDSPSDHATFQAEVYELNIKIENGYNFDQLIEAQHLRKIIGKVTPTKISKQEITGIAHGCDIKMASVVSKIDIENRALFSFIESPFTELLRIFFLALIIWWVRRFSKFFGGLWGTSEIPVLFVFVVGGVLLSALLYSAVLINLEPKIHSIWDILFSVYGLYHFIPVGTFLLFRSLIKKYKGKHKFIDLEFGKYIFILVAWVLLCFLQEVFFQYSFKLSNPYFKLWPPLSVLITGAIFFATANFLNNFRAHYFELRRKGKSLKVAVTKGEISQSELQSLQSRVNPHFLYNSLNSIASLATINPVKTEQMSLALSNFYKYNTNRQDEIWTTVGEEMIMVQTYLDIEKIRFEDQLEIQINVDEDCRNYKIPRFIIQPLVENAVKYGYNEKASKINITVDVNYLKKDNSMEITIQDDGLPFTEDLDAGYGFNSVQKKLKIAFRDNHHFGFINSPKKSVNITIMNPEVYA